MLINCFVQTGVIGLGLFLAAHAQMVMFFKRRTPYAAAMAAALVIGFLISRNLFDDFVYGRLNTVYAGLLGLLVGVFWLPERAARAPGKDQA